MLDKALRDIEFLRAPKGYLRAGWPRFFWYFSRDSLIAAWQTLKFDPGIAASTLKFAASQQAGNSSDWRSDAENGMIPHQVFLPGDQANFLDRLGMVLISNRYYGSIDATPLFVILAYEFYRCRPSGFDAVLSGLESNIRAALLWIASRLKRHGLLAYKKRNPFGFTHQSWRDGFRNHLKIPMPVATVDAQGYAFAALWMGSELFRRLYSDAAFAEFLAKEAYTLRMNFASHFWWKEEKTYYFALAGKDFEPVMRVVPDPAMALFSGIIPKYARSHVVSRIFKSELWTPYGARSISAKDPRFQPDSYFSGSVWPWVNWLIWKGLLRYGFYREAELIKLSQLNAVLKLGGMPEAFAVFPEDKAGPVRLAKANPVQAWSCGAILDMLING